MDDLKDRPLTLLKRLLGSMSTRPCGTDAIRAMNSQKVHLMKEYANQTALPGQAAYRRAKVSCE